MRMRYRLILSLLLELGLSRGYELRGHASRDMLQPVLPVAPTDTVAVETPCGHVRSAPIRHVRALGPEGRETGDPVAVAPFLGMRYARPLVTSDQRFRIPEPAQCWPPEEEYDASTFRDVCLTQFGQGEEDCLYIHVYAPTSALNKTADSEGLPVFVFIHPGWFYFMDGHTDLTKVAGDKERPAVWVSFEYRLSVFGFLAIRELSEEQGGTSGNYGIWDQVEALRWVQANIASFGGDPSRVTLFGSSAGATSIYALLMSPVAKGLFHAAIAASGAPNTTIDMGQAEVQNNGILPRFPQCAQLDASAARMACLRNQSRIDLIASAPANWTAPNAFKMPVSKEGQMHGGILVVDGKLVTRPPLLTPEATVIDVPLIIGSMAQETDCCAEHVYGSWNLTEWESFVDKTFSIFGPDAGAQVNRLYHEEAVVDPQKAFNSITSDFAVTCGNMELARNTAASASRQSPVYLYNIRWGPSQPIMGLYPQKYAYHIWDMAAWWRNYPDDYAPDAGDAALNKILSQWFYAFGSAGRIPEQVGWTPVSSATEYSVMVLEPPQPLTIAVNESRLVQEAGHSGGGGRMIADFKRDVCEFYASIGMGPSFWWSF